MAIADLEADVTGRFVADDEDEVPADPSKSRIPRSGPTVTDRSRAASADVADKDQLVVVLDQAWADEHRSRVEAA